MCFPYIAGGTLNWPRTGLSDSSRGSGKGSVPSRPFLPLHLECLALRPPPPPLRSTLPPPYMICAICNVVCVSMC